MRIVRTSDPDISPELQCKLTQFVMNNAFIEIFWVSPDARIHYVNRYACILLGYTKHELLQLSVPDIDPDYPIERWNEHWQSLKHEKTRAFETLHKRRDGTLIPVELVSNYVSFDGHEYNVGFGRDIRERKRAEAALQEKEEFFRLISENADDFIVVLDLGGRRLYNNPAYSRLFGDVEALKGTDSFSEIHPDDREYVRQLFKKTIQTGAGYRAEFRFMLADGSIRYMESSGTLIKNASGDALHLLVVSHDITDRRQAENVVHELAFHDPLTKLPNRRLLRDRLEQIMASSARNGLYGALMFLDLDNFKPLNDEHGHEVGDMLLIEVASRLRSCVREMDTVARFGGDEFVVLLNELDTDQAQSVSEAAIVAEKIRVTLAEPYLLHVSQPGEERVIIEHHCTSSIGVVVFIGHDRDEDEIIRSADKAMYQSKEAGRNRIRFCDATG